MVYCLIIVWPRNEPFKTQIPQSRSQSLIPLEQWSENESSGNNHYEITKEITEFCPSGFTQSASMAHA